MGGDGGDNGAMAAQQADEDRKAGLRTQINQLYGIPDPNYAAPTQSQFTSGGSWNDLTGAFGSTTDQPGYDQALATFNASGGVDPVAKAAQTSEAQAESTLSNATSGYYNDQLQHATDQAFRNNRFALADRGTLGGSAQIDTERELSRDNTLGATRVADQVASAVAGLKTSNEQERLNAIGLVNSGSGQDAVQAAQSGLQTSLANANSQQKANITSDLFQGGANAVTAANTAYNPLLLQQYQNQLQSFFGPSAGTARSTPTG